MDAPDIRFPWEIAREALAQEECDPFAPSARPVRRGRRPAAEVAVAEQDGPQWPFFHLLVTGPRAELDGFAAAARGPGTIPWVLDFDTIEEDAFLLAASQPPHRRSLSIEGCRILARQMREQVEARQARALAQMETSAACAFDLHRLVPIPAAILSLGPGHPRSLAWLAAHWGAQDGLRHVASRPGASPGRRLPIGHAVLGYSFFSRDTAPQPAIDQIGRDWPRLRLRLIRRTGT